MELIKNDVPIIVTDQSLLIIQAAGHSLEDFYKWAVENKRISLGGVLAVEFIEIKQREKNGSTTDNKE